MADYPVARSGDRIALRAEFYITLVATGQGLLAFADNPGDLVGLAQILGHENLNTTARYTKHTQERLGEAAERLSY